MALKNYWWNEADKTFRSWLKKSKEEVGNQHTEIIKSVYFVFKKNLRGQVEKLSFNSYKLPIPDSPSDIPTKLEKTNLVYDVRFKCLPVKDINDRIIKGIISGNQIIFNQFYEDEFPKIAKLTKQNSGNIENAKDLFQDGVVILFEKISQKELNFSCSLGTYLYSICRYLWMNELRKNNTLKTIIDHTTYLNMEVSTNEVERLPDTFETVKIAIESLGNPCKQLLERYYYLNQSWGEIADELGYSNAASARNQKYKCLERIRKMVNIEVG